MHHTHVLAACVVGVLDLIWPAFGNVMKDRDGGGTNQTMDPAIIQAMGGNTDAPPKLTAQYLGNPAFTCKVLEIAIGKSGSVVAATSEQVYTEKVEVNYSPTCWLDAACIVSPRDEAQTARVLAIISLLQTKFAVRSIGHKANPGFASIDASGVLISLDLLTSLSLSGDGATVRLGPGLRWSAVYEYLVPRGLAVAGGRVPIVGVGGYLLGAGISHSINEVGLGIDSIKSYRVALADGRVVTASHDTNAELYRALRGGGTNLGIVVSYDMYTFPVKNFHWEERTYAVNQSAAVLRAMAEWQLKYQAADPRQVVYVMISDKSVLLVLGYSAPVPSLPATFAPFLAVKPFNQLVGPANGTFIEFVDLADAVFNPTHLRMYGETFSHKVDANFMVEAQALFANITAPSTNTVKGFTANWVPNAIPASATDGGKAARHGASPNLLGLDRVPQQWHEWFFAWDDAKDDAAMYALAEHLTAELIKAAREANALLPFLFISTAGKKQPVLQSYGSENVQFIRKAAAKYDPSGVFQKLQNDGYLLRNL